MVPFYALIINIACSSGVAGHLLFLRFINNAVLLTPLIVNSLSLQESSSFFNLANERTWARFGLGNFVLVTL